MRRTGNRVTFQAVSKIDKSISKRTGARRCHPQDIHRMPMFVCLLKFAYFVAIVAVWFFCLVCLFAFVLINV